MTEERRCLQLRLVTDIVDGLQQGREIGCGIRLRTEMEIADSHRAEPVFQVSTILVLRVGDKHEQGAPVVESRTHTDALIVGKTAVGDIHLGAELGDELLLKQVAGTLHAGVDDI